MIMLTKLNALILGCIFIFVTHQKVNAQTDSNGSEQQSGTHIARVIVSKAIVYSDENLNSPLGYISNDKLISVGNPRKKNPDIVPLIVYGRLAFIESKNIHFEQNSMEVNNSKRGAPREHNIDLILAKPEEKLAENNSAFFFLHTFSSGSEVQNLVQSVDGVTDNSFTGFGMSLIHRQSATHYFWGIGLEYDKLSTSNLDFSLFILNPTFGYNIFKSSLFLVDLTFSLDAALSASLTIKNNPVNEPQAFLWGPQLGARVLLFPYLKYHLTGSLGYRQYNVLKLESLQDINGASIDGITTINGFNLSIGFAMEI
ncbi:MAG: hypothetical protein Q7U04_14060 [Bacteriovorax sp.]|nr:hypothetical protein [Bacteriovorax sp.]